MSFEMRPVLDERLISNAYRLQQGTWTDNKENTKMNDAEAIIPLHHEAPVAAPTVVSDPTLQYAITKKAYKSPGYKQGRFFIPGSGSPPR